MNEEAHQICVIVHGGKGLKSNKKGRCKFSVIFGIGSKKFRTDVVEDVFGSPTWNEEALLEVEDASQDLVLTATEKDDILGQVTVQLNELPLAKPMQGRRVPLRAHKKCPEPQGELVLSAWITEMRTPRPVKKQSPSAALKTLKKMKSKIESSPLMRRKSLTPKESKSMGMKGSMSVGNLIDTRKRSMGNLLSVPSESMCSVNSTDSDSSSPMQANTADMLKRPEISGISPREGSIDGGTRLTLRGLNLGRNIDDIQSLYICGADCTHTVEYESTSKLYVTTIPWRAGAGDIIIQTVSGGRAVAMVQFTFRDMLQVSPLPIHKMSPLVTHRMSPLEPGRKLMRHSSDASTASGNSMNVAIVEEEDGRPEVSGISPKEGPIEGGTKLTIRGRNLGESREDIICVMICGKDCTDTLEYESPRKLVVVTKAWKPGSGEIVVDTTSGGQGSSTVKFTYLMPPISTMKKSPSTTSLTERIKAPASPALSSKSSTASPSLSNRNSLEMPDSYKASPMLEERKVVQDIADVQGYDLDSDDENLLKPEVTGVTPKEAPSCGGTRVTLRGINLGANRNDVIGLTVCGANCLPMLEYESPMKLHFITPPWKEGSGKILLETKIGGLGSSLVQFKFVASELPESPSKLLPPSDVAKPPRRSAKQSSRSSKKDLDNPPKHFSPTSPSVLAPASSQTHVPVAGVTQGESSDYFGGATPYPDEPHIASNSAAPQHLDAAQLSQNRTDSASPATYSSPKPAKPAHDVAVRDTTVHRPFGNHESRPTPLGQEKRMSPLKERKYPAPPPPGNQVPSHKPPPHPGSVMTNHYQDQSNNYHEQEQRVNMSNLHDQGSNSPMKNLTQDIIVEKKQEREIQSGPTRQELMEEIRRVKIENRDLHEQNHLMKQYLERLVTDVMLRCPDILCVDHSKQRPY